MAVPGWQPLIVCNKDCEFGHLILLVKNLITDLVLISTLLATMVFIYIGIILLTSGGNPGAMTKAKDMFMKVVIGYLWILAAWLLVYTITSVLLKPEFTFLLGAPK